MHSHASLAQQYEYVHTFSRAECSRLQDHGEFVAYNQTFTNVPRNSTYSTTLTAGGSVDAKDGSCTRGSYTDFDGHHASRNSLITMKFFTYDYLAKYDQSSGQIFLRNSLQAAFDQGTVQDITGQHFWNPVIPPLICGPQGYSVLFQGPATHIS
jgi:hypothetical protein